jgi:hypothetical protein
MNADVVSFKTVMEHYGIWRWRIELEPSNRLVEAWSAINASALADETKVKLTDVAWAAAAFERAYHVLLADIVRAEKARKEGVPALMWFVTGKYKDQLYYLLTMSLWMDLADVFVAYRTIPARLKQIKRHGKRRAPWTEADIRRELDAFEARTLPELSQEPVTRLADWVLHHSWDTSRSWDTSKGFDLSVQLYWKDSDPSTLDFAEGDFRASLSTLVDETLEQVDNFISGALQRHAAAKPPAQP